MRYLVLLLFFFNFFDSEYNKVYSRNKENLFPISSSIFGQNSKAKLIFKNGFLTIEGLNGKANVTIYSIIGNKIAFFSNIELRKFKEFVSLQKETMYITRIELSDTILTYKFFTR